MRDTSYLALGKNIKYVLLFLSQDSNRTKLGKTLKIIYMEKLSMMSPLSSLITGAGV